MSSLSLKLYKCIGYNFAGTGHLYIVDELSDSGIMKHVDYLTYEEVLDKYPSVPFNIMPTEDVCIYCFMESENISLDDAKNRIKSQRGNIVIDRI